MIAIGAIIAKASGFRSSTEVGQGATIDPDVLEGVRERNVHFSALA